MEPITVEGTQSARPESPKARNLLAVVGRHLWWILAVTALTAFAFGRGDSPSQDVTAAQQMVLRDVGYHELPGVHSFQQSWLEEQMGDAAPTYVLDDGPNSTTFAIEHTAATADQATSTVDDAVRLLSEPSASTAFSGDDLVRIESELEAARNRLDGVEGRLETARTEHRRLSSQASPVQVNVDQAGQETWALASERDLWIRRVSEVEVELQNERFEQSFASSVVGKPTIGQSSAVDVGNIAAVAAAIVVGLVLLAFTLAFQLLRSTIRNVRHLETVVPSSRSVDLSTGPASASASYLARLVEQVEGEVLLVQTPIAGERWLDTPVQRRLARLTSTTYAKPSEDVESRAARTGNVVLCVARNKSTARALRADLARLNDLGVDVVSCALLGDNLPAADRHVADPANGSDISVAEAA